MADGGLSSITAPGGGVCIARRSRLSGGCVPLALGSALERAVAELDLPAVEIRLDREPRAHVRGGVLHHPGGFPHPLLILAADLAALPVELGQIPAAITLGDTLVGYLDWPLPYLPLGTGDTLALFDEIWAPEPSVAGALRTLARCPVHCLPPLLEGPSREPSAAASGPPEIAIVVEPGSIWGQSNFAAPLAVARRLLSSTGLDVSLSVLLLIGPGAARLGTALAKDHPDLPLDLPEEPLTLPRALRALERCAALLHLPRAVGFDPFAAHALLSGIPIVGPRLGTLELLDDSLAWPVEARRARLESDVGPYPEGAVWAEPDLEAAARQLSSLLARPGEASERAERGRALARKRWQGEATRELWRERLSSVLGGSGSSRR